MIEVGKHFEFEAAHFLPHERYGKCQNVHGHTYKLTIKVGVCSNEQTTLVDHMVINFTELSAIVKKHIIERFDHTVLNESTGLEFPTAEELVLFFVKILQGYLPENVDLNQVVLYETSNSFAIWNWKN